MAGAGARAGTTGALESSTILPVDDVPIDLLEPRFYWAQGW
jgi:hypothetical protein